MLRYENNSLTADSLLINTTVPLFSFGVDEQNELYGVGYGGEVSGFPKGIKSSAQTAFEVLRSF